MAPAAKSKETISLHFSKLCLKAVEEEEEEEEEEADVVEEGEAVVRPVWLSKELAESGESVESGEVSEEEGDIAGE